MISSRGAWALRSLDRNRRTGDRPDLHLVDLRVHDAEAHPTRAEHRIRLLSDADAIELRLQPGERRAAVQLAPHDRLVEFEPVREELVQRRIKQPDRHRPALHRLKQPLEVALLQRQQLVERAPAARLVGRP